MTKSAVPEVCRITKKDSMRQIVHIDVHISTFEIRITFCLNIFFIHKIYNTVIKMHDTIMYPVCGIAVLYRTKGDKQYNMYKYTVTPAACFIETCFFIFSNPDKLRNEVRKAVQRLSGCFFNVFRVNVCR
jgi:hypothetical protein